MPAYGAGSRHRNHTPVLVLKKVNSAHARSALHTQTKFTSVRSLSNYGRATGRTHEVASAAGHAHCARLRWGYGWLGLEEIRVRDIVASIGYRIETGSVVLSYSQNGEPFQQQVPIYRSRCYFGGERHWFGCPRCGRRIALLYLRNRGFACRSCNRIAYSSQSEDAMGRAWRKQSKIERRLADEWRRPKGMHLSTYERLVGQIIECEDVREVALYDRLGALMRRHPTLRDDPLLIA